MKKTLLLSILGTFLFTSCESEETTTAPEREVVEAIVETESNRIEEEDSNNEVTIEGDAKLLIGTWKLSDVELGMDLMDVQKEMMNAMIAGMIENTTMTFKDDGAFESNSEIQGQKKVETGSWSLDGMELTSTDKTGKEKILELIELTAEKFIVSMDEGGNKMTLTFIK